MGAPHCCGMPNPGTMTSLQAFERESINTVVYIPDYKLRQQLSSRLQDPLIVEAFSAYEDMYYLHLSWDLGTDFPHLALSTLGSHYHTVVLELSVQSPHFAAAPAHAAGPGGGVVPQEALQWTPCTWSAPLAPFEVHHANRPITMTLDKPPTHHNERALSLAQAVTFTLTGTVWKLDSSLVSCLQCKSYRNWADDAALERTGTTARMSEAISSMRESTDTIKDVKLIVEDVPASSSAGDAGAKHGHEEEAEASDSNGTAVYRTAHSFVLQAHSAVFARMLAGPMVEAKERAVRMVDVTVEQLDDFLAALYRLGVPNEARNDEGRLLAMLEIADRYEVAALRDECAALLVARINESNMAKLLLVADRHQTVNLKTAALDFITNRTERVAAGMDTNNPSIRSSIRDHLASLEQLAGDRLRGVMQQERMDETNVLTV